MLSAKLHLYKFLLRLRKPGVVFYGHNVSPKGGEQILPTLHLKPAELERTISLFKSVGVEFVAMEKVLEIANSNFQYHKPWVHITFDDGYKENLTLILPIMEKHGIPFSVFISSNHIATHQRFYSFRVKAAVLYSKQGFSLLGVTINGEDSKETRLAKYKTLWKEIKRLGKPEALNVYTEIDSKLSTDEWDRINKEFYSDEILTVQELVELSKHPLVHIGSHCHHHLLMNASVRKEDIEYEMAESQRWLSMHLNRDIFSFCYPNGGVDDATETSVEISKKYYKLAFTTLSEFPTSQTNRYLIPRQFLLPDTSSILNRMALPAFVIKLKTKLLG